MRAVDGGLHRRAGADYNPANLLVVIKLERIRNLAMRLAVTV